MGGLAAAMRLRAAGVPVMLLERAATPGGKMRQVMIGDAVLDAGPTVFTMEWVFEALFTGLGERLRDHVGLEPLPILARHAWPDGSRFDLPADLEAAKAAVKSFAGAREAEGFSRFCCDTAAMYATLKDPVMTAQKPSMLAMGARVGLKGLPGLLATRPFSTLWSALSTYFQDPRLRQLFGRYATYTGGSPWLAPAPLMLIAHVEQSGVWAVQGGMHALAMAMTAAVERAGAEVRFQTEVREILAGRSGITGIVLASGERIETNRVLFNGDSAALPQGLLGKHVSRAAPVVPRRERSLSAQTYLAFAPTKGFPLLRHTVFFSDDYAREFTEIFRRRRLPTQPTVYICAQDRPGSDVQPLATLSNMPERLLMLINAPADGDEGWPALAEVESARERMLEGLQHCGLEVSLTSDNYVSAGPQEFAALFAGTGGALYGRAPHGWAASFVRPGSRTPVRGLYLVGGSVHPSAGVPMAALSGQLGAEALLADQPPGRIQGGRVHG